MHTLPILPNSSNSSNNLQSNVTTANQWQPQHHPVTPCQCPRPLTGELPGCHKHIVTCLHASSKLSIVTMTTGWYSSKGHHCTSTPLLTTMIVHIVFLARTRTFKNCRCCIPTLAVRTGTLNEGPGKNPLTHLKATHMPTNHVYVCACFTQNANGHARHQWRWPTRVRDGAMPCCPLHGHLPYPTLPSPPHTVALVLTINVRPLFVTFCFSAATSMAEWLKFCVPLTYSCRSDIELRDTLEDYIKRIKTRRYQRCRQHYADLRARGEYPDARKWLVDVTKQHGVVLLSNGKSDKEMTPAQQDAHLRRQQGPAAAATAAAAAACGDGALEALTAAVQTAAGAGGRRLSAVAGDNKHMLSSVKARDVGASAWAGMGLGRAGGVLGGAAMMSLGGGNTSNTSTHMSSTANTPKQWGARGSGGASGSPTDGTGTAARGGAGRGAAGRRKSLDARSTAGGDGGAWKPRKPRTPRRSSIGSVPTQLDPRERKRRASLV